MEVFSQDLCMLQRQSDRLFGIQKTVTLLSSTVITSFFSGRLRSFRRNTKGFTSLDLRFLWHFRPLATKLLLQLNPVLVYLESNELKNENYCDKTLECTPGVRQGKGGQFFL
jgi:hypothetical protein